MAELVILTKYTQLMQTGFKGGYVETWVSEHLFGAGDNASYKSEQAPPEGISK